MKIHVCLLLSQWIESLFFGNILPHHLKVNCFLISGFSMLIAKTKHFLPRKAARTGGYAAKLPIIGWAACMVIHCQDKFRNPMKSMLI